MGGYPRSSSPALSSANQVDDLEPASYTSFHDLLPDGSWPNSPQPDESDKRQFWSRFLTSSPSSSPSPVPELPASPSINNNGDGSLDVSTSSSSVLMWDSAPNSAQVSSDTRDSGLSSARAASPAGSLLTQGRKHSYPVPLSESGATPAPRIARQKQQQQQLNDRINHSINTGDSSPLPLPLSVTRERASFSRLSPQSGPALDSFSSPTSPELSSNTRDKPYHRQQRNLASPSPSRFGRPHRSNTTPNLRPMSYTTAASTNNTPLRPASPIAAHLAAGPIRRPASPLAPPQQPRGPSYFLRSSSGAPTPNARESKCIEDSREAIFGPWMPPASFNLDTESLPKLSRAASARSEVSVGNLSVDCEENYAKGQMASRGRSPTRVALQPGLENTSDGSELELRLRLLAQHQRQSRAASPGDDSASA